MENNNEIIQKLEYLDNVLQKDLFSNPVREVQDNIRKELVEFREIFLKNLEELEVTLVTISLYRINKITTLKSKLIILKLKKRITK
jgi:hypothetical protein